jgi:hypothetical protein
MESDERPSAALTVSTATGGFVSSNYREADVGLGVADVVWENFTMHRARPTLLPG